MAQSMVVMFLGDPSQENPGEDVLTFMTGYRASDTEYTFHIQRESLKEIENGYTATGRDSSTTFEFIFFREDLLLITISHNNHLLFNTNLYIDDHIKYYFYEYIHMAMRDVIARRLRDVRYLSGITTPKGVGIVENTESLIGEYLSGKRGPTRRQIGELRSNLAAVGSVGGTRRVKKIGIRTKRQARKV